MASRQTTTRNNALRRTPPPAAPLESDVMDIASPPDASGEEISHTERIAKRAYDLYLQRGGIDGHDMNDWLQAEREVDEESLAAERRDD